MFGRTGVFFRVNYRINRTFIKVMANQRKSSTVTSSNDSTKSDDTPPTTEQGDNDDHLKSQILKSSLAYVNKLGWSREAIQAGSEAIGYPGTVHGLFPNGESELLQYFIGASNQQMVDYLEKNKTNSTLGRSHEVITAAIRYRLSLIVPYIERWPSALAIMASPPNAVAALALLLTMADDICHYAGDESTNSLWYMRRVGVAGIYKMTEVYMLQDQSESHEKTWQFLSNRINEARFANDFFEKTESTSQLAADSFRSAIILARNLLGLPRT